MTSALDTFRSQLSRRPNLGGCVFALVFWWRSLTPSMLPRGWMAQAVIGAASALVGYGLGTFVGWLVHLALGRLDRRPSRRVREIVWSVFGLLAAGIVAWGGIIWPRWQQDQRRLLGWVDLNPRLVTPMLLLTIVLVLDGLLLSRVAWWGIRSIDSAIAGVAPRAVALAVTTVVVIGALTLLVTILSLGRFDSWANSAWRVIEADAAEGAVQPPSRFVSGSPASLVTWEQLGQEGRGFVVGSTTEDELRGFSGPQAEVAQPIRIYVGLQSAIDAQARAALAVREMDRTGAFGRKVLVVATPTGTGRVDPAAARAIEQLYRGDTAIVAIQYSVVQSWMSSGADRDSAKRAGAALFDAVAQRWSSLPSATRPKLLVFGEGLGSLGAEAAFTGDDVQESVTALVDRADGALFTAPTSDNSLWHQLVAARDERSPAWRPVYDDGRSVRFVNAPSEALVDASWKAPRVLYVLQPTDPVTFWSMSTMWARPDWLDQPRGSDIPAEASWFPFVTWAQSLADLQAGFAADSREGHEDSEAFVAGWAAVAPPDGWTDGDTRRLETYLVSKG